MWNRKDAALSGGGGWHGGENLVCTDPTKCAEKPHAPTRQSMAVSPRYTDRNDFLCCKSLNIFQARRNYLGNSLSKIEISSAGGKNLEKFKIKMLKKF